MSTAYGTAFEPIEISPDEIMHVLFVEHDDVYRKSISKDLEKLGCLVVGVNDPKEAIEKLSMHTYQLVIVDIGFPSPAIPGDQFITLHHSLMQDAQLVALTGQRFNIKCTKEFDELGVIVIDKGEEDQKLEEVSKRVYERAKDDVLKRITEARVSTTPYDTPKQYPLAEGYLSELEHELLENLDQIENKERQIIHYKGNDYSVSSLIDQVKKKTDIGGDLVRMMLALVRWRQEHAHAKSPHIMGEKPLREA